jgi:hypothetical protein
VWSPSRVSPLALSVARWSARNTVLRVVGSAASPVTIDDSPDMMNRTSLVTPNLGKSGQLEYEDSAVATQAAPFFRAHSN